MYLFIEGSKDRYDSAIDISIIGVGHSIEIISVDLLMRVIEDLKTRCEKEYLDTAIQDLFNKKTCIQIGSSSYVYTEYDKKGNIIRYTTGCPNLNEYEGVTYQIVAV